MTLSGLAFAATILAQSAAPVASAPTTKAEAAQPKAAKTAGPKKVCVTEAQLGSHFRKRVCATPEEWEARRVRDAEEWAKSQGGGQCRGEGC